MPWIGLGIVEWNPCCYGLLPSLFLGYDIFLSFAIPEARLALCLGYIVDLPCLEQVGYGSVCPYVLGTLWTYRALRYLHFESTRHFSVREIFE